MRFSCFKSKGVRCLLYFFFTIANKNTYENQSTEVSSIVFLIGLFSLPRNRFFVSLYLKDWTPVFLVVNTDRIII